MKVEVILKVWGTYKIGDVLDVPDSTAQALIKSKVVKESTDEIKTVKTVKKQSK